MARNQLINALTVPLDRIVVALILFLQLLQQVYVMMVIIAMQVHSFLINIPPPKVLIPLQVLQALLLVREAHTIPSLPKNPVSRAQLVTSVQTLACPL